MYIRVEFKESFDMNFVSPFQPEREWRAAQFAGRNARSVGVKKLKWKHQAFYLDLKKS